VQGVVQTIRALRCRVAEAALQLRGSQLLIGAGNDEDSANRVARNFGHQRGSSCLHQQLDNLPVAVHHRIFAPAVGRLRGPTCRAAHTINRLLLGGTVLHAIARLPQKLGESTIDNEL
jgi:hypothetical protein